MSEKHFDKVPASPQPQRPRPGSRRGTSFLSPRHVDEKRTPADSPALDGGLVLPPPAVAFVPPGAGNKLQVRWQKLKRRIGNGSAPSESLGDPTNTTGSDAGSSFAGNRRNAQSSTAAGAGGGGREDEDELVDEVVVEQSEEYDCWKRTTIPSQSASHRNGTGTAGGTGPVGTMPSDGSSLRQTAYETNGPVDAVVGFARYRVWPYLTRFFAVRPSSSLCLCRARTSRIADLVALPPQPSYHDPAVEDAYQKEVRPAFATLALDVVLTPTCSLAVLVQRQGRPHLRRRLPHPQLGPHRLAPPQTLVALE